MPKTVGGSSKSRDARSDDQTTIGNRIKSVAANDGLSVNELCWKLSLRPGIRMTEESIALALIGRPAPRFNLIVDAAADIIAERRDEPDIKGDRWTKQELDLRKRTLRHFFIEGEDDERYELHELEQRIREVAIARIEQEGLKAGWKLSRYDWGVGLSNPGFDRSLLLSRPMITIERKDKEWLAHDYWNSDISGFVVSAARKKSLHLTNDRKIRIASDFIGRSQVVLQPTRYFSSLATDQIAWSRFSTSKTKPDGTPEQLLWDGMSAFIDEIGRLKRFEQCSVSNQVGASVMALTEDGEMLISHQNKHNHQSQGRLAPSGSGSLDWEDVGERTDFLDVARVGAERELQEECVLVGKNGEYSSIGCELLLTGFVRMVHRAGKPEFLGLARVDGKADDICNRKQEKYVEKVFNAPIEKANWSRPASPQIARMCRGYLEHPNPIPLSFPLQYLLNHLIEVCEDPKRAMVINKFMAPRKG